MVRGISLKLQTTERTAPLSDLGKDKELQSEFFPSYLGQHLEHGPKEVESWTVYHNLIWC